MEDLKIVVAGHIDHGKSTLIGRLLYETDSLPQKTRDNLDNKVITKKGEKDFASITDQLEEEQEKSITIDTTQTQFTTAHGKYTLIDTPGHKEFLKNMLTGTTKANAAILVIDATEGILDQTLRHAYLISMVGIKQIIVAINKMDKENYNRIRFWDVSEEIVDCLNRLNMEIISIIPISAQKGDNVTYKSKNMNWYKSNTLLQAIESISINNNLSQLPLRFLVQCPYVNNGITRILGKIATGRIFKNQKINFGPIHQEIQVISLEVGNQETSNAQAGDAVAIVTKEKINIGRGQVGFNICLPPIITNYLKSEIFWIGSMPLRPYDKIDILCGTKLVSGQVEKITKVINPISLNIENKTDDILSESLVGDVKIKLEQPICIDNFYKIPELGKLAVIRDNKIMGCGIVK